MRRASILCGLLFITLLCNVTLAIQHYENLDEEKQNQEILLKINTEDALRKKLSRPTSKKGVQSPDLLQNDGGADDLWRSDEDYDEFVRRTSSIKILKGGTKTASKLSNEYPQNVAKGGAKGSSLTITQQKTSADIKPNKWWKYPDQNTHTGDVRRAVVVIPPRNLKTKCDERLVALGRQKILEDYLQHEGIDSQKKMKVTDLTRHISTISDGMSLKQYVEETLNYEETLSEESEENNDLQQTKRTPLLNKFKQKINSLTNWLREKLSRKDNKADGLDTQIKDQSVPTKNIEIKSTLVKGSKGKGGITSLQSQTVSEAKASSSRKGGVVVQSSNSESKTIVGETAIGQIQQQQVSKGAQTQLSAAGLQTRTLKSGIEQSQLQDSQNQQNTAASLQLQLRQQQLKLQQQQQLLEQQLLQAQSNRLPISQLQNADDLGNTKKQKNPTSFEQLNNEESQSEETTIKLDTNADTKAFEDTLIRLDTDEKQISKRSPKNEPILDELKYCNIWLCGDTHIACNATDEPGPKCPKDIRVIDLKPYKDDILTFHNTLRNKVAGGTSILLPATRMATMQWNDELAYFAELNAKRCYMDNDKCHSTSEFRYSGQNLATYTFTLNKNEEINENDLIRARMDSWVSELEKVTVDMITKYQKGNLYQTATVMISDKNRHVGCGAVLYGVNMRYTFSIVCNYAYNNLFNYRIYKMGKVPGSECQTGLNPRYPNLCSVGEIYKEDEDD